MLGERIEILRGDVSKGAFADRFNIHKNTLINYETGYREPKAGFLSAVCEEFNVQPNWLLLGIGPKHWGEKEKTIKTDPEQDEIFIDAQEWLNHISEEEPERKAWFKIELLEKFPLLKDWIKKRKEAESEFNHRRIAS